MPWTETARPHYEPRCRRYASDLTDAEWALLLPASSSGAFSVRPYYEPDTCWPLGILP